MKSYVGNDCGDCRDVAIVYMDTNYVTDCDNIVEVRTPVGGTKERYLAKHFSPEFIDRNRFQCATVPYINAYPNNVIDNMNQKLYTVSDQQALVARGVKDFETAKQFAAKGELTNDRHNFRIEMNKCNNTAYPKMCESDGVGSTRTGLRSFDKVKGYYMSGQ